MNFDFSDDQRLLAEEVRRMLAATSTSAEVRRSLEGEAPYSQVTWRELLDMGAATAALPAEYGGAGLGYLELCLVAEEAGRHLAAVPLASSIYLAMEALVHGGSEAQKAHWLPRQAGGEILATANLGGVEGYLVQEQPRFDDGALTGSFIAADGAVADIAILRVGNDLLLAELSAPGVAREPLASLDPTRPYARLRFDAAPAQVLAGGRTGAEVASRVLNGAAVLLAFEQIGGADSALEASRQYAMERKAFGRQIGSFQALKHKMADIYTANQLARAHAFYGAWALSCEAAQLPLAAAAARVSATRAYTQAAEESIEIHGGIGFTWEMDCHLHFRRARYLGQLIGSEHAWREQLAEALIEEAA